MQICPQRVGLPRPTLPARCKEWTVVSWRQDALDLDPSIFHCVRADHDLQATLSRFPSQKVAVLVGEPGADLKSALQHTPVDLVIHTTSQRLDKSYGLRAKAVLGSQNPSPQTLPFHALPNRDALQAARAFVREYAKQNASGMQSALNPAALPELADRLKTLTAQLQTVPKNLLYTTMLAVPPMAKDPDDPLHEERDLGTFLQAILADERYPDSVREQAIQTRRAYEQAVLSQWSSSDKKALRYGTGASVSLPWKHSTQPSPWAQDTGWNQLLEHVFQGAEAPQVRRLGTPFQEYKRYISPFQDVRCSYTPSCSEFMKESIEKHGLWSGAQIGMLRFIGCDGSHICSAQCACPKAGDVLVPPVNSGPITPAQRLLVRTARWTGKLLGGLALSAVGLAAGIAVGGWVGVQPASYRPSSVQDEASERGWQRLKTVLGGTGLLAGALTGALGGLAGGWALGAHFGGLWAQNRTRELLGQLPPEAVRK